MPNNAALSEASPAGRPGQEALIMIVRVLRRATIFVLSLVVSSVLVFAFMAVLPGDPARIALGIDASDKQVHALRVQFGLDQSLTTQYVDWVRGLLTFKPGTSYISHAAIGPQIADRLEVTLVLVIAAMLVAGLLALPMGLLMAVRQRKPSGLVLSALSQVGVAVPAFLAGILLVTVFAVRLGWLPPNGWTAPAEDPVMFVKHLILPALSLGLVQGRYSRDMSEARCSTCFARTTYAQPAARDCGRGGPCCDTGSGMRPCRSSRCSVCSSPRC